ncbi:MAG: transposase [Rikenellaceae bacterium]
MSEIGPDEFSKFKTAKQFTSWLRLAPNNKISGGKIFSNHIPRGSNRLKIALRQAANAIRVAYRKGRQTAVSATARKLAVIIWNMVTRRIQYQPPTDYLFLDQKRKLKLVSIIKQNIVKFDLKPEDVGFATH